MTLAKVLAFVGPGTMSRIVFSFIAWIVTVLALLDAPVGVVIVPLAVLVWCCREIYVRKYMPDSDGYVDVLIDRPPSHPGSLLRIVLWMVAGMLLSVPATAATPTGAAVVNLLLFYSFWHEIYVRKRLLWPTN